MNLTKSAINNNRVTYILLLMIVIMGITGYQNLPRDSMPPSTIRIASVVTNFPGASPERVERLVSDPIEEVVQELPELNYVRSESRTGISIVMVALQDDVDGEDLQAVWDKLRRKIDGIKKNLPEGIEGPIVKDDDVGEVYGIILGLIPDGFDYAETKSYADVLRNEIIAMDNAARVELGGVVEERIFVDFTDAELVKYNLSGSQLKNIISATNIIIPSGEVKLGKDRIIMEPTGNLESVDDIKNILIPLEQTGTTVKLGDITRIRRDYIYPKKTLVKVNGSEAITLYISLKDGANIIELGEEVDALVAQWNKKLPAGLQIIRVAAQDHSVASSVDGFIVNLVQAIVIVLLVMFMFLGIRTGLVVASLIPAVILSTFLFMDIFGVGLNQVSLAALIMALGMLVDNAIVVSESMMVHMERGKKALDAAIISSKELIIPLLISSLTTSAAFLAFFLAQSTMGEIMGPLFSVISLALISSWLLALTMVPLIAIALIRIKKNKKKKASIFDKLNNHYAKLLHFSLARPVLMLLIILGMFGLSLLGYKQLPFIFMPDNDRDLVTFDMNLPLGTSIETSEKTIKKVEDYIASHLRINESRKEGIVDWSAYIGQGPKAYDQGYSQAEANSGYAHLLLNTTSDMANQTVIDSLEKFSFENLPDAITSIKRLSRGGGAATPIEVRVQGDDISTIREIADGIKEKLYAINGTKNVDDDWGPKIKKLIVQIDQTKLSQSGLTNQDIGTSLNAYLSGQKVGVFREGDDIIPIILEAEGIQEVNVDNVESLNIFGQGTGKNVPLSQFATVVPVWENPVIFRRDIKRTITVESRLQKGVTATDITNALIPWLDEQSKGWKHGYSYELGGESESSSDAMGAVIEKLPLSFFIILFLLVVQFKSFRKTAIVLATIPLGIIGVIAGLLLAQSNLSFTAFLGIISLAGIVINNAIVLLDRIEMEITEFKRTPYDALIQATNERFRPILLTTFTTSLGMIPLWISGGDMWSPMAVAIIFGLLFATFITLVFVPVVYQLFFKAEFKR